MVPTSTTEVTERGTVISEPDKVVNVRRSIGLERWHFHPSDAVNERLRSLLVTSFSEGNCGNFIIFSMLAFRVGHGEEKAIQSSPFVMNGISFTSFTLTDLHDVLCPAIPRFVRRPMVNDIGFLRASVSPSQFSWMGQLNRAIDQLTSSVYFIHGRLDTHFYCPPIFHGSRLLARDHSSLGKFENGSRH
jgi:hypothetical protein